jgi:hypothetical protein
VTAEHGARYLDRVARLPEGVRDAGRHPVGDDVVDDRSAALLIRVWLEDAGEFRARLLTQPDATAGGPAEEVTVAVASSPEAVLDAVRDWLDDFRTQAVNRVHGDR